MDRLYRDHRRTEVGTGYPVPPPRPKEDQEPSETEEESGDEEGSGCTEDSQDVGRCEDLSHAGGERDTEGEEGKGAAAPTPVVPQSHPVTSP